VSEQKNALERRSNMAITRWNPFREMDLLRREMNRLFDDWPLRFEKDLGGVSMAAWSPNVDIFEDENEVVLSLEVPGINEKDIHLSLEGNTLTISGERKLEKEDKKDNYHRIERCYGSFSRSFSLPSNIEHEKISASMDKGVLKVTLPKKEETKPKKIEIKVGK